MKTTLTDPVPLITFAFAALAAFGAIAQEKPFTQAPIIAKPPPPPTANVATNFTEAFSKGKFNLNVMLRYEFADQSNLAESYLLSIRPRFGFTTATYLGFQGMIEAENVTAITDTSEYNAAGSNGQGGRTIIADPETTEINQAWLSYSNWDSMARAGRQRIVLDNSRWIGDVIWRQNQQTYDAVRLENSSIENLTLLYAYLWHVNRIFGDVPNLPAANRDFESDSHLVNVSYSGLKWAKLSGYAYLLDFTNGGNPTANNNSSATYGGFISGTQVWDEKNNGKVNYRGEFAWQTDYGSSALNYSAPYYLVEATADYSRFTIGAGYEVLGSDNSAAVRAPLALLHGFNGWADVFLTTPANGLHDLYFIAAAKLPYEIPLRVVLHQFNSDTGGSDYGREFDVVASRKFGKYVTALVKYAHYEGQDAFVTGPTTTTAAFDKDVFWAQIEFNY